MLKNYLKIALKVLFRKKLFTVINLLGICFTLSILLVATSLLDNVVGPGPPETNLDRMLSVLNVYLTNEAASGKRIETIRGNELSYYFLNRYVKSLKTPELVSICSFHDAVSFYHNGTKAVINRMFTDAEFWEILDFQFLEGKPYTREDVAQVNHVVVINEAMRAKLFGKGAAVGNYIRIEDYNYRVIGVVSNVPILRFLTFSDIWIPYTHSKENFTEATLVTKVNNWHARILAHRKSDIPKIKAEFARNLSRLEFPDGRFNKLLTGTDTYFEDLARHIFITEQGSSTPILAILFLMIIIFMVLPVLNLANINISRIIERSTEIGVRKAFGASSLALLGQFVVENIVITCIGGIISLGAGSLILEIINRSGLIIYAQLALNYRIFGYSLGIWLLFALFSGAWPAFRMSRMHPVWALRGGSS